MKKIKIMLILIILMSLSTYATTKDNYKINNKYVQNESAQKAVDNSKNKQKEITTRIQARKVNEGYKSKTKRPFKKDM